MTAQAPATRKVEHPSLVAGLDLLTHRERDADALAHRLADALTERGVSVVNVATHWAEVGQLRHIALSVEVRDAATATLTATISEVMGAGGIATGLLVRDRYVGEDVLRSTVTDAIAAHTTRRSGRAVVFPGSNELSGLVRVRSVLALSAIDRVHVLAAGDADPDALLNTRDFLRPRWRDGELVLDAQAAVGGTLVPFESPSPTPCCADHA